MINRREFSRAFTVAVAGVSLAAGCSSTSDSTSDGGQSNSGSHTSFPALRQIDAGALSIGYAETGPADGAPVLLHGWPYDIYSYVDVAPLLAASGYRVIVPYLRGFGTTRFLSGATVRNGQQSVVALDVIALMDALKIQRAVIGGFDWGARTACVLAALWPDRCKGLSSASGYLITNRKANLQPLPPMNEYGWWYQFYFATERGERGYSQNTLGFNKLIWKLASPNWDFDDATYNRSAASFANPDHASIVIHNYRWRLSLADGESEYDGLEQKLSDSPVITAPTITIASDFDGAATNGIAYRAKFSGKYDHRVLTGIGHNVPQEAPKKFADAVIDVDTY